MNHTSNFCYLFSACKMIKSVVYYKYKIELNLTCCPFYKMFPDSAELESNSACVYGLYTLGAAWRLQKK